MKRYIVDYSDRAYPKIVAIHPDDGGTTFREAKAELVTYVKNARDHWTRVLKDAQGQTTADVVDWIDR